MTKKHYGSIMIPEDPPAKPSLLAIGILLFIVPPISTVVGLYLGYKRLKNEMGRKRFKLYRRYANAIGDRREVSLRGLAASMGMPLNNVLSDIQGMIDEGFMGPEAYIDHSHMILYLTPSVVETQFVERKSEPVQQIAFCICGKLRFAFALQLKLKQPFKVVIFRPLCCHVFTPPVFLSFSIVSPPRC